MHRPLICLVFLTLAAGSAGAVSLGQVDDFQDGTVQSWSHGNPASPNPPVNVGTGGPAGAGDAFLQNDSTGNFGPGGKMVVLNDDQWTGNYLEANVDRLGMDLANFGEEDLFIRIALMGSGTWYGSNAAFVLPADGQWYSALFLFSDLVILAGGASLDDVLSGVDELRILSAEFGPDFRGDQIVGSMGIDNITAIPLPAALVLMLGGLVSLAGFRRRHAAA